MIRDPASDRSSVVSNCTVEGARLFPSCSEFGGTDSVTLLISGNSLISWVSTGVVVYSLFRSVVRLGGGPQSHSLSSEVKMKVKMKMNGQSDELEPCDEQHRPRHKDLIVSHIIVLGCLYVFYVL